jgi:hypothetical protein
MSLSQKEGSNLIFYEIRDKTRRKCSTVHTFNFRYGETNGSVSATGDPSPVTRSTGIHRQANSTSTKHDYLSDSTIGFTPVCSSGYRHLPNHTGRVEIMSAPHGV